MDNQGDQLRTFAEVVKRFRELKDMPSERRPRDWRQQLNTTTARLDALQMLHLGELPGDSSAALANMPAIKPPGSSAELPEVPEFGSELPELPAGSSAGSSAGTSTSGDQGGARGRGRRGGGQHGGS